MIVCVGGEGRGERGEAPHPAASMTIVLSQPTPAIATQVPSSRKPPTQGEVEGRPRDTNFHVTDCASS